MYRPVSVCVCISKLMHPKFQEEADDFHAWNVGPHIKQNNPIVLVEAKGHLNH